MGGIGGDGGDSGRERGGDIGGGCNAGDISGGDCREGEWVMLMVIGLPVGTLLLLMIMVVLDLFKVM